VWQQYNEVSPQPLLYCFLVQWDCFYCCRSGAKDFWFFLLLCYVWIESPKVTRLDWVWTHDFAGETPIFKQNHRKFPIWNALKEISVLKLEKKNVFRLAGKGVFKKTYNLKSEPQFYWTAGFSLTAFEIAIFSPQTAKRNEQSNQLLLMLFFNLSLQPKAWRGRLHIRKENAESWPRETAEVSSKWAVCRVGKCCR
jgi:hypothetical protein